MTSKILMSKYHFSKINHTLSVQIEAFRQTKHEIEIHNYRM
jgi:hypothetical protein